MATGLARLSAWELYGAAWRPPADRLTCWSTPPLSLRDRDCPLWLLRSGTQRARWPLRPELEAPLGVWMSSQLARFVDGRGGWRLSGAVAVLGCCTSPASSAHAPVAVLTCRPSVFQAGHNPSCRAPCERAALSSFAGVSRRLLLLLSPLLSVWSVDKREPSLGGDRWMMRRSGLGVRIVAVWTRSPRAWLLRWQEL